MIAKKKGVNTLMRIIGLYFERLVTPGSASKVTSELLPCFL